MRTSRRSFLKAALAAAAAANALGEKLGAESRLRQSPAAPRPMPDKVVQWDGTESCSLSRSVTPSISPSHGPDEYQDENGYWRVRDEDEEA